jgi:hypothetical protein
VCSPNVLSRSPMLSRMRPQRSRGRRGNAEGAFGKAWGTLTAHSGNKQETLRVHLGNGDRNGRGDDVSAFGEHTGNIQGTFRENTFREHAGDVRGIFWGCSGNTQGTFRDRGRRTQGACATTSERANPSGRPPWSAEVPCRQLAGATVVAVELPHSTAWRHITPHQVPGSWFMQPLN